MMAETRKKAPTAIKLKITGILFDSTVDTSTVEVFSLLQLFPYATRLIDSLLWVKRGQFLRMTEISEWTVWQLVQMSLAFVACLGILTMDNITYTKPELGGELLLMVLAFSFYRNSQVSISVNRQTSAD
ncbi:hypothetical protein NDI39_30385 [Microcoleus sp. ZQ-A2]|jgi:hypothetical protein|nr:hypothetical protein [Microcoleus sp. FACHB-1]